MIEVLVGTSVRREARHQLAVEQHRRDVHDARERLRARDLNRQALRHNLSGRTRDLIFGRWHDQNLYGRAWRLLNRPWSGRR